MKLKIPCSKCMRINPANPQLSLQEFQITDDGVFKSKCKNGHIGYQMTQSPKFESLFELGCYAFLDGYYLQSVSTLASSLERFHEWCIKIMLRANEITFKNIDTTWNLVSNQSERQLGTFYFLYLQNFNEVPYVQQNKDMIKKSKSMIELRNKVVHKGVIPTKEETLEYVEYIYNYLIHHINIFKQKYEKSIAEEYSNRIEKLKKQYESEETFDNFSSSIMGTKNSLGLYFPKYEYETIEIVLKNFQNDIDFMKKLEMHLIITNEK